MIIKEINTYKSIPQQFSVSLAVDHMHHQTHAVHTITGHFRNDRYTYTHVLKTFVSKTGTDL